MDGIDLAWEVKLRWPLGSMPADLRGYVMGRKTGRTRLKILKIGAEKP